MVIESDRDGCRPQGMRIAVAWRGIYRPKHMKIYARRFDLIMNAKLSLAGSLFVVILLPPFLYQVGAQEIIVRNDVDFAFMDPVFPR